MTPAQHYAAAESYLKTVNDIQARGGMRHEDFMANIAVAQVHATLAATVVQFWRGDEDQEHVRSVFVGGDDE